MRSLGWCWAWPTLCREAADRAAARLVRATRSATCRGDEPGVTPWQILVSEFMLQQTPVARVEPIWLEWVARWPTPSATAAASAADVLRAWGKLGYPRRAKRLHECATVIATEHGDVVPSDVETLLTLPGIGAYTARAVACFAYRQRVPVVDTNVRRVVARVVHGRADASRSSARDLDDVAALLPDDADAPRFSVALMELGATVCTARSPRCGLCPLTVCAWRSSGYPAGTARRAASSGMRAPIARCAAGCWMCCAATTLRSSGAARRGVADRHRTAGPRAGFAARRRTGGADR